MKTLALTTSGVFIGLTGRAVTLQIDSRSSKIDQILFNIFQILSLLHCIQVIQHRLLRPIRLVANAAT